VISPNRAVKEVVSPAITSWLRAEVRHQGLAVRIVITLLCMVLLVAPTLLDPEQTRVYECVPAISKAQAKKFDKKPGKSFHFVLNDIIAKDNRIPPKGFKNSTFKEHLSEPVGAVYADDQHWDNVQLELPSGCERIVVNLMYQSVSWEYLKFLTEENRTDDWGKRLYEAWSKTDKCAPVVIAEMDITPLTLAEVP